MKTELKIKQSYNSDYHKNYYIVELVPEEGEEIFLTSFDYEGKLLNDLNQAKNLLKKLEK